jgi:hypothetical protein
MTCTTKQQIFTHSEASEPFEREEKIRSIVVDAYDEEARRYRQYLAQQEAFRQLEKRKTQALASSHRISFFR